MSGICTHGLSLDSPCVRCAMTAPIMVVNPPGINNAERRRIGIEYHCAYGHATAPGFLGDPPPESCSECDKSLPAVVSAVAAERSRIRALILKHYANDWTANELLKEVDRG